MNARFHSRFEGEVFQQDGVSYLVVGPDHTDPDWLLVKSIDASRRLSRMRAATVASSIGGFAGRSAQNG